MTSNTNPSYGYKRNFFRRPQKKDNFARNEIIIITLFGNRLGFLSWIFNWYLLGDAISESNRGRANSDQSKAVSFGHARGHQLENLSQVLRNSELFHSISSRCYRQYHMFHLDGHYSLNMYSNILKLHHLTITKKKQTGEQYFTALLCLLSGLSSLRLSSWWFDLQPASWSITEKRLQRIVTFERTEYYRFITVNNCTWD